MSGLRADRFPETDVRARARRGSSCAFPDGDRYGRTVFGAADDGHDPLDAARLVPPIFVPGRMDKLVELGREPLYSDVELGTDLGGFASSLPMFLSAFGSTRVASGDLGVAVSAQAGRLGIPMVIGENVVPVNGYGSADCSLVARLHAYAEHADHGRGGVVVQQSTEDADAEVWNLVYSDPAGQALLESGRLGFELKIGQGAKPGLGGMTMIDRATTERLADQYAIDSILFDEDDDDRVLRSSSPGTITGEILRQQIRLMRNNFPRARVWVKLHPGRDVRDATAVAWAAGADAVTVDGAEGGSGWAPTGFLDHVGLPLGECLARIGRPAGCLLVTSRMWEGTRAVKSLALGARAVGLGRAALLAADEDPESGLLRLADCLALEMRMLISALGKYDAAELDPDDVWSAS
ncbi:glutamate synthase-related protein [[Actinomadura] parvosata]|uniref:glutamate synthase-related protein n=1 Tax=[Actinomadura] parvosata TaxID=1955412 RepID=UPI00406CB3F3